MNICIYHANCNDGFCAAWVLNKYEKIDKFIPMSYGVDPFTLDINWSEVTNLFIVDFSFKRDVLVKLNELVCAIWLFDHHESARKELEGLEFESGIIKFDMERSGASLVADYFGFAHWLVDYTEDRDLWRHKLTCTKEVNAYLQCIEKDFKLWDELTKNECVAKGAGIVCYKNMLIDEHLKYAGATIVRFNGEQHVVPCCTTSVYSLVSDIAERMYKNSDGSYKDVPFVVVKHPTGVSLRSGPDGMDVSVIASAYGGGGHKHAAGISDHFVNFTQTKVVS